MKSIPDMGDVEGGHDQIITYSNLSVRDAEDIHQQNGPFYAQRDAGLVMIHKTFWSLPFKLYIGRFC